MKRVLILLVVLGCFGLAIGWVRFHDEPVDEPQFTALTHPNGLPFAGSETCKNCHAEAYQDHLSSAHYHTSALVSASAIKGSFVAGQNEVSFGAEAEVVAEHCADGFYQVGYIQGQEVMTKPFEVVIGSGRKGQTYLFWHNNRLYQLPLSYFAPTQSWTNSPGYPTDAILFNRPINGRCLECHSTYALENKEPGTETTTYNPQQMILGVTCERCHGPAANHVTFHTKHPDERQARHLITRSHLSRQQRLDACALCHSGLRQELKPAFSFVAGDRLTDFSTPDYSADSLANLDVHGNQYGLLMASRCFQNSPDMDCSSCHSVHKQERNDLTLFSQRCLACHERNHPCSLTNRIRPKIKQNCIDCHMPSTPSQQIALKTNNRSQTVANRVRTHHIRVYPKATDEMVQYLNRFTP